MGYQRGHLDKMKQRTENLRIGYQMEPTSHQGPMANAAQLATVEEYVRLGQEEGATILTGGKKQRFPGWKPDITLNRLFL